ncbi:hypothetical protein D3C73_871230 [compost metagenome]
MLLSVLLLTSKVSSQLRTAFRFKSTSIVSPRAGMRRRVTSLRYPSKVLLATCFFFASSHLVKKPFIVSRDASGANFAARAEPGNVTE